MMGRVSSCSKLYVWRGPEPAYPSLVDPLAWKGTLSPAQKEASLKAVAAIRTNSELLIWAVCGAGKTEILFEAIAAALAEGKRICFAAPRTDVVLELAPRLRAAFPKAMTAALYGGSEERHTPGQLILTTTHQLYRFRQAFDVMIIDEVDAFPFSADLTLRHAAERARKNPSSLIYLTATPSNSLKRQAASGGLPSAVIPARFHRHPIPVPDLQWSGNWEKSLAKKKIPIRVKTWLEERLQLSLPFLIFFPSIKKMEEALPLFQAHYPEIAAVHSEDPHRKEKVLALREGRVPGLLTTTILERGVTIPRLDVCVLGAEQPVFTESALVQIAGRVGRKAEHPHGSITFFHFGRTEAMLTAVKHIKGMNREGEKRGLLN
ncbi:DEAD/DEAH box helicase [Peribacillus sp. SCS-26]|uniref:DEAD/DEAH box helicase n=1 Tax=Paraperibacillus marinus TaxID=3115295 RepID=UPI0039067FEC